MLLAGTRAHNEHPSTGPAFGCLQTGRADGEIGDTIPVEIVEERERGSEMLARRFAPPLAQ